MHYRRNPCRGGQYETRFELIKARKRLGEGKESKLLDAIECMLSICSRCPYKT